MRRGLILLFFLVTCWGASAQRTVYGTFTIGTNYYYTLSSHGGALNGGYNLSFGYLDVSASACLRNYRIGTDGTATALHLMGGAGYMLRVASARNRSVALYLGGGVLVGQERISIDDSTLSLIKTMGMADSDFNPFQVGVYPKVAFEWYLNRHFAFELVARAPVLFMSLADTFYFETGIGVKYNF